MSSTADRAQQGYDAAVAYINAATGPEDRMRRKAEVFHVIYGHDAARATAAPPEADEGGQDTRPGEREEDDRDYPDGESTDARLKRWLVDNGTDPRIRETEYDDDDQPLTVPGEVTMSGADLYDLLHRVAERMYFYGADDVRERHGIR